MSGLSTFLKAATRKSFENRSISVECIMMKQIKRVQVKRQNCCPALKETTKKRIKQEMYSFLMCSGDGEKIVQYPEGIHEFSQIRRLIASKKTIWVMLAIIRLMNAMLIQTYFVPDEFWQSVEVAHKMAFGYGYLTWEWRTGIRSFGYPLVFAIVFHLLGLTNLDYRILLIRIPHLLQGIFASIGDLFLCCLSRRLSGHAVAQWTLLCSVLSWFNAYSCTRTLTNSTEMVFVTMALYYFPWPNIAGDKGSLQKFVVLAATAVIVRPTSAVLWLPLCAWQLQDCKRKNLKASLQIYFVSGLSVLGASALIDRIFYGHWVLVTLNFLHFNVMRGGSSFYGINAWHWYFTQGIPVILGSFVVPFLLGIRFSSTKVPLVLLIWFTTVFSFLPHKEFRFLLPVLPLSVHYCGEYLHSVSITRRQSCKKYEKAAVTAVKNKNDSVKCLLQSPSKFNRNICRSAKAQDSTWSLLKCYTKDYRFGKKCYGESMHKAKYAVVLLSISNLLPFFYFSLIHQRGTVDVMNYLYHVASNEMSQFGRVGLDDLSFLFLMPCHSTPYYSFLHFNLSMQFLTCEPNIYHTGDYKDEAEIFFIDPEKWLSSEYKCRDCYLPTHIIYFSSLQEVLTDFLIQNRYKKCAQFFHSHIPEKRTGSHVLVSCR